MLELAVIVPRGGFVLDASLSCAGVTAILGPNGSGKTTLLRAILGVLPPRHGRITLSQRVLYDSGGRVDVPVEDRQIAYVPQGYGLFPHLSAVENVGFGMRRGSGAARRARSLELLGSLELLEVAHRRPASLSGGEQQRVALARAVATDPKLLLLDEPLAALDATARPRVRRFLRDWLAETKLPALVVTHDPGDARELADELVVLEAGRVVQSGSVEDVARSPATAFVAALSPHLCAVAH